MLFPEKADAGEISKVEVVLSLELEVEVDVDAGLHFLESDRDVGLA